MCIRDSKYAMREAMDIATIGCAAAVRLDGTVISGIRLAYSVSAPIPVRCPSAEAAALGLSLIHISFVRPELTKEDFLALPKTSPLPLGIVLAGFWPMGIGLSLIHI